MMHSTLSALISTPKTTYEGIKCLTRRYTLLFLGLYCLISTLILRWYAEQYNTLLPTHIILINLAVLVIVSALYLGNLSSIHAQLISSVRTLIDAIRKLKPDNPATPLEIPELKCHDELHEVVDAINEKSYQIQHYIDYLKEFIWYVQHEFNTPLSIIALELERLQAKAPEHTKQYASMQEEILFMRWLAEQISLLLHTSQHTSLPKEQVNLYDTIIRLIAHFQTLYPTQLFTVTGNNEFLVQTIPSFATIVIKNILENACKYWSEKIDITLKQDSLMIRDFGTGIESKDLPYIWLPFWRGNHHPWWASGLGLWLPLVKKLCDALWWTVTIESTSAWTAVNFLFNQERCSH